MPNKKYCSLECQRKSLVTLEAYKRRSKTARDKYPIKFMLKRAKKRAIKNNLEFNLTEEDIKVPEFCPALGIELKYNSGDSSPSLDRVDNSKGYTKDNISVISNRANILKRDATKEELRSLVQYMDSF